MEMTLFGEKRHFRIVVAEQISEIRISLFQSSDEFCWRPFQIDQPLPKGILGWKAGAFPTSVVIAILFLQQRQSAQQFLGGFDHLRDR